MAVVKVIAAQSSYRTYAGTSTEVITALAADGIPGSAVVDIVYNPDLGIYVAFVRKGQVRPVV